MNLEQPLGQGHASGTPPNGKGYAVGPGEGVAGYGPEVKASGASTAGTLSLIESHTRGGAPWHVHTREDEYLYVTDGELVVHCRDEVFRAVAGAFVFLPRGVPHAWDVVGGGTATVLMMTAPAMLEEFLREFHAATADERTAVAARYGITFLPPPAK